MCVVLFLVSLQELGFWGCWSVSLWTPLCYFVDMMHLFSQCLNILQRCEGRLLNVTFTFLNARCIRWPCFALIRVSCHCLIDVMLPDCVCCRRSIRTQINVCSMSFHLLLPEFDKPELRQQLIHWSSYQVVERPNFKVFPADPGWYV